MTRRAAARRRAEESPGAPLSEDVRARMETKVGAPLDGVRVHTGEASARAATEMGARAFTVDQHVHFGADKFDPGTREGERLLTHELTHTTQQQSGVAS